MKPGKQKDGYACRIDDTWSDYTMGDTWNETEEYRWFRTTFEIPKCMNGMYVEFLITTGREGEWDATNPQMLFYLDGNIVQGIDVNHREVTIAEHAEAGRRYEAAFLAYSGSVEKDLVIHTYLTAVDKRVEKLYYDLLLPIQSAFVLKNTDQENYRRILQKL